LLLFIEGIPSRKFLIEETAKARSAFFFADTTPSGGDISFVRSDRWVPDAFTHLGQVLTVASRTGLFWLNSPMKAEKFAEIFRFFDPLSFSNDQAFGVDDFVVLKVNLRIIVKIENLLQWTKMLFRSTVTIETPPHGVGLSMINLFHLVNFAVATYAGNSAV
jgi:hypothetical protein